LEKVIQNDSVQQLVQGQNFEDYMQGKLDTVQMHMEKVKNMTNINDRVYKEEKHGQV
jgi:hypothetical protein